MGVPVKGSLGAITFDSDGAGVGAAVTMAAGSSYEFERETQTEERGPYIGDPAISEVPTGLKRTFKLEGDILETGSAFSDAVNTYQGAQSTAGTLVMYTTKGKQITLTNVLITKFGYKADAKGTQTVSIEGSATGDAIAAAPTS